MSKKIIALSGPMKTGSTAIQSVLDAHVDVLRQHGIVYRNYTPYRAEIGDRLRADLKEIETDVLVVSSEFLCVSQKFHDACRELDAIEKYSLLVYRPLVELYPSLYLQNLKGPRAATIDFEEFVSKQFAIDRSHRSLVTTFDFEFLNNRMQEAGFVTHWIKYTRENLVSDMIKIIESLSGETLLPTLSTSPPPEKYKGISPLRSLNMASWKLCVKINKLYAAGVLSEKARFDLLGKLVDLSQEISKPSKDYISDELLQEIVKFDEEINCEFYERVSSLSSPI